MAKRFWATRQAAVSMQFALMLVPLLGAVEFGVDYAGAMALRDRLLQAADAAVIAGVAQPTTSDVELNDYERGQNAQTRSKAHFQQKLGEFKNNSVSFTTTVDAHAGQVSSKIDFTASYIPAFGGLFGLAIPINGSASALSAKPLYADIYALVDASGSMGIGASPADQALMVSKTGCAFGCHVQGTDATARKFGATLRFDVVQSVLAQMISSANTKALIANQFRFGVYKFSNDFTTVADISTDTSSVAQKVRLMELDLYPGAGTNFHTSVKNFIASKLPTSGGDGSTPDKPMVFVLILTDGIGDDVYEYVDKNHGPGSWYKDPTFVRYGTVINDNNQYITGFDPSICTPIKNRGITVMTLDMQYYIPSNPDQRFRDIRDKLKPQIQTNLQACATSVGYAYNAQTASDVDQAIRNMFDSAMSRARITQ